MKRNTVNVHKINIDTWRKVYAYVLPTIFVFIYIIIMVLMRTGQVEYYSMTDSDNLNNMLDAIITFVSIVIGIFGFLLPILITNKKDGDMVEYFLDKVDKKKFIGQLKSIIIGGFSLVLASSILFLSDIFLDIIVDVVIGIAMWLIVFFMCNAYRFISLLLSILISNKENGNKPIKDEMSEVQIAELNKKLKSRNNS